MILDATLSVEQNKTSQTHKIIQVFFKRSQNIAFMSSSAFTVAMDKAYINHKSLGENGAAEYMADSVNDPRVALFFALVRDLPQDRLKNLLFETLNATQTITVDFNPYKAQAAADVIVMAIHTRYCRGGKGEKALFYRMVLELSTQYPKTLRAIMCLVPRFGSYRDWFQIIDLAKAEPKDSDIAKSMLPIVEEIIQLASEQLLKDRLALITANNTGEKPKGLSLLAKWAPREKRSFGSQASALAKCIFPTSSSPKRDYRKVISSLNNALGTTETLMCSNRWDEINFEKGVPSICLMKNRKSFLNEKLKSTPPTADEMETGNRFPSQPKRVECRKRLRHQLLDKAASKLKGRQLFPHQIVREIRNKDDMSSVETEILDIQWKDIRNNVIRSISKLRELSNENSTQSSALDLGKMVSLVDVSGSMCGTPMEVAIALGILVSELSAPAFANRCITFSERPTWVKLSPEASIFEKVQKLSSADWGCNTNFELAMENILQVAVEANLEPHEIPDLIVFSDMQFDEARSSSDPWETHHERIVRRFSETGKKVCGQAWPAPNMIYWNLRGDAEGLPAQANTPNVTMLSGFSPALMKLLLDGEELNEEIVEEVKDESTGDIVMVSKKVKKNPYTTLRKALDSEEYDAVWQILKNSEEGALAEFKSIPNHQGTLGEFEVC